MIESAQDSRPNNPKQTDRRHDLDALRAFVMFLGIALHAALAYFSVPFWPVQDSNQHEGFGLAVSAIHGFRMPVFFLLSGFFTAMLWRRKGLTSLLKHRVNRLGIPLLLSLVTVIPLMNCVIGFAQIVKASGDPYGYVFNDAKRGSVDALETHLDDGLDLSNITDREFGMTPLSWAAISGHKDAVLFLIDNGSDVQSLNGDGGTALHAAAFLGRTEVVAVLIERGADINSRNGKFQTPMDVSFVDLETTKYVVELLSIDVDLQKLKIDRMKTAELLRRHDAKGSDNGQVSLEGKISEDRGFDTKPSGFLRWYLGIVYSDLVALFIFMPVFHHLWFLWYLVWLVAGFLVCAKVASSVGWRNILPRWVIISPANLVWLVPLTSILQIPMGQGGESPVFGPDTAAGLFLLPHLLLYYAIFFGFGVLYFDSDDQRKLLGRLWWVYVPVSIVIIFPLATLIQHDRDTAIKILDPSLHRSSSVILQSAYPWLMAFGLMGIFQSFLNRQNYAIKYLSDSAYWLYLIHLPLIILLQVPMSFLELPATVKFVAICAIATTILLFAYHNLVRYSWLGTILNGKRTRSVKPRID